MNWYALFVKTGKEKCVEEWLDFYFDKNTLSCFIPRRKLIERKAGATKTVLRPLFPGYVLIYVAMDYTIYYKIKSIPRLISVLRISGSSYFSAIPNIEIETIKQFTDNKGIIDFSIAMMENTKVKIIYGPLKGKEGCIQKIDKRKKRAKIKLFFNGLERYVDIGIDFLEPTK